MNLLQEYLLFGVYSLAVVGASASTLGELIQLSRDDAAASHHILVPFITLALCYQRRHAIFALAKPDLVAGCAAILTGAGLVLTARSHGYSGSLSVAVTGFVLMWIGGFLLFFGREASRVALFPLLFLGFMIPMPSVLIEGTTSLLKTGSAEVVAFLFTLTRTPYERSGFVFTLPAFAIEIADECSGFRSSIALMLTGLLAGNLFLHTGWRKAVIVLAVLPLAVIKNGIRIVSLSLLATYVDPAFLTGALHHDGGVVFFAVSLTMLVPLVVLLCNSETTIAAPESVRAESIRPHR